MSPGFPILVQLQTSFVFYHWALNSHRKALTVGAVEGEEGRESNRYVTIVYIYTYTNNIVIMRVEAVCWYTTPRTHIHKQNTIVTYLFDSLPSDILSMRSSVRRTFTWGWHWCYPSRVYQISWPTHQCVLLCKHLAVAANRRLHNLEFNDIVKTSKIYLMLD